MFGGMVMIPREPLVNGHYDVTVDTGRQTLTWSFVIDAAPSNQVSNDR
jgi:hypothetical protein